MVEIMQSFADVGGFAAASTMNFAVESSVSTSHFQSSPDVVVEESSNVAIGLAGGMIGSTQNDAKTKKEGSSKDFVVWTFPFAPPSPWEHDPDTTIICPYRNACLDGSRTSSKASSLNLRSLTEGSYFHQYVRDHAYHKVRHGKDFPLHIQAISMLSILLKKPSGTDHPIHFLTFTFNTFKVILTLIFLVASLIVLLLNVRILCQNMGFKNIIL